MKIKEIKFRLKREVEGILKCEHCGHEEKLIGAARDITLNMECPACRKKGKNNE